MIQEKYLKLFQALSSETRLNMLELLLRQSMNASEIAKKLGLSQVIVTRHLTQLQEAGIINSGSYPGKRGNQRLCAIAINSIAFDLENIFAKKGENHEEISIPVGSFIDYSINPSCGLASKERVIGIADNPKYFSSPEKYGAGILWFGEGWVKYRIPSYLFTKTDINRIEISLELCSEFPFYKNDFISDIYFYINDLFLGIYESPGDFGDRKGNHTPLWWNFGTEYGLLKKFVIDKEGTFIDGKKTSEVNIDTLMPLLNEDLDLKIAAPKEAKNPGGINIFGKGFGDYDQDINIKVFYE